MSIVSRRSHPVKPYRRSPKPDAPFAAGLDGPCSCSEAYTCLGCLDREHRRLKGLIDLDRRFGPDPDELQWNAETSPANAAGYDILSDAAADLKTAARWSEFCNATPDDEGDWR